MQRTQIALSWGRSCTVGIALVVGGGRLALDKEVLLAEAEVRHRARRTVGEKVAEHADPGSSAWLHRLLWADS